MPQVVATARAYSANQCQRRHKSAQRVSAGTTIRPQLERRRRDTSAFQSLSAGALRTMTRDAA